MCALLDGVRVLDFSRVLAGPLATMILGDLGAEVIKVEPPGGDETRQWAPFLDGESVYFMSINRNKKSIVIDLRGRRGATSSTGWRGCVTWWWRTSGRGCRSP